MTSRFSQANLLLRSSLGLKGVFLALLATAAVGYADELYAAVQSTDRFAHGADRGGDTIDACRFLRQSHRRLVWALRRKHSPMPGVTVGADLVLEGFDNFQGGLDTAHLVGSTTFDLSFTFDLEKLQGLHGGEFYIDLEDHAFRNPTKSLVGDLQVFDKENNSPFLQFFRDVVSAEIVRRQSAFESREGGCQHRALCVIDNVAARFLVVHHKVSLRLIVAVMPTTPDPMPSINAFFTPTDLVLSRGVGAYYSE